MCWRHMLGTSFTLGLVGWSPDQVLGMDPLWWPVLEQSDITVKSRACCASAHDLPLPQITRQRRLSPVCGSLPAGSIHVSRNHGVDLPGKNLPVLHVCMF